MTQQLCDYYIPKKILFREKELAEIRNVFENFKKYKVGVNIALLGVTGSGKTTIIKKIVEEKDNSIYILGSKTKSPCNTIKEIVKSKKNNFYEVQKETIEKLRKHPKIIIIDEIDKVSRISELFDSLNLIYRETSVPIIISTLKRDILEKMPIDAKKTLFFERINLPAYNSMELKKILIERLKEIEVEIPLIDEGTINYISALAGRQGSARILLNLTLRCLQKGNFDHRFIDETFIKIMKEDMFAFVGDINETEREFLKNLFSYADYENEFRTGVLEKVMGLSAGRICQLTNTFEKYGVIISRHRNLGRSGGRQRFIKFINKERYDDLKKIGSF